MFKRTHLHPTFCTFFKLVAVFHKAMVCVTSTKNRSSIYNNWSLSINCIGQRWKQTLLTCFPVKKLNWIHVLVAWRKSSKDQVPIRIFIKRGKCNKKNYGYAIFEMVCKISLILDLELRNVKLLYVYMDRVQFERLLLKPSYSDWS